MTYKHDDYEAVRCCILSRRTCSAHDSKTLTGDHSYKTDLMTDDVKPFNSNVEADRYSY